LSGREQDVASYRKFDAVLIVRSKKVLALEWILPSLKRVNRYPTDSLGVKLGPAMVTSDLPFTAISVKWKLNGEESEPVSPSRGIADEDGMEVGTVTSPFLRTRSRYCLGPSPCRSCHI